MSKPPSKADPLRAEHEAGMHDSPKGRFPGRGPHPRCVECKREAADLDRRYA